jgi:hypothetical protein
MALSNAERQRRYRVKLKAAARAAGAAGAGTGHAAELLRHTEEGETPLALLGRISGAVDPRITGAVPADIVGPILADILGLPRDPWPDLTPAALAKMLKGRMNEAKRRGHHVHKFKYPKFELTYSDRLRAAVDRKWLEGGVT